MPVEIREISISMTLLENGAEGREEESGRSLPADEDMRPLVDACVNSVLRILKDKREP